MTAPEPEYEVQRLSGMRGAIAGRMMTSLQTTAQLTFHTECDAGAFAGVRAGPRSEGPRPGIEDLLIGALARAIPRHPGVNGVVVDREIRLYRPIRICVAIALDSGLVAPALPDARGASDPQIATWRADAVNRAREGRLKPAEMTCGTFTLTNLGRHGVRYFTPLLNVPQIAILGIGAIRRSPMVDDQGRLAAQPVLPLSLTVDHRAIDGEPAARFLADLCAEIGHAGA